MSSEHVSLPEGVKIKTYCKYVVELDSHGQPWVKATARVGKINDLRMTVPKGLTCNVSVGGQGSCNLRFDGGGDGDAHLVTDRGDGDVVRTGSGNGNAVRGGKGAGHALRLGSGEGNAVRKGHGYGDARREGAGAGDAWRREAGQGNAVRRGAGKGDAVRIGGGHGDAVRKGSGEGDAMRIGAGKGDAHRYAGGAGIATRERDSTGSAFQYPEETSVKAWLEFMVHWVRCNRSQVLERAPAGVHGLAWDLAEAALTWLMTDNSQCLGALIASSPELAAHGEISKRKDMSVAEAAKSVLHTRMTQQALAEMRAIRANAEGKNVAGGEVTLETCFEAVREGMAEARDELMGIEVLQRRWDETENLAIRTFEEIGLSLADLAAVFDRNPDLWEEKALGNSVEDQMRCALLGRMKRYAREELVMFADQEELEAEAPALH